MRTPPPRAHTLQGGMVQVKPWLCSALQPYIGVGGQGREGEGFTKRIAKSTFNRGISHYHDHMYQGECIDSPRGMVPSPMQIHLLAVLYHLLSAPTQDPWVGDYNTL